MAGPQDDHLDAYLDAVLVGAREDGTVEVVAYREDWPVRYQAERDVHVHIWRSGRDDERRLLLFRDRSGAEARTQYEEAKRSLAGRYRDVNYYAEAKSTVIGDILRGAVEER